MNIYIGNLAYEANDEDLKKAFETFGQVSSANVIKDKYTMKSKGFGFVEMPSEAEAKSAIEGLNGKDLGGNTINVNEARPKVNYRGGRGSGQGGGGRF